MGSRTNIPSPLRFFNQIFCRLLKSEGLMAREKYEPTVDIGNAPLSKNTVEAKSRSTGKFLFKVIDRPANNPSAAEDLSIENAALHAGRYSRYTTTVMDLTPPANLFYERIHAQDTKRKLGVSENEDARYFTDSLDKVVRVTSDNAAKLFVVLAPVSVVLAVVFFVGMREKLLDQGALIFLSLLDVEVRYANILATICLGLGSILFSLTFISIVYGWFFTMSQRQNVAGLDSYILSELGLKLNRFQQAIRQFQNVEKRRIYETTDSIRAEARMWLSAANWQFISTRLYEEYIKYSSYRVRRNTRIFGAIGFAIALTSSCVVGCALAGLDWNSDLAMFTECLMAMAVALGATLAVFGLVLGRAVHMMFERLRPDRWQTSDKMQIERVLGKSVGEDKSEILRARDWYNRPMQRNHPVALSE